MLTPPHKAYPQGAPLHKGGKSHNGKGKAIASNPSVNFVDTSLCTREAGATMEKAKL